VAGCSPSRTGGSGCRPTIWPAPTSCSPTPRRSTSRSRSGSGSTSSPGSPSATALASRSPKRPAAASPRSSCSRSNCSPTAWRNRSRRPAGPRRRLCRAWSLPVRPRCPRQWPGTASPRTRPSGRAGGSLRRVRPRPALARPTRAWSTRAWSTRAWSTGRPLAGPGWTGRSRIRPRGRPDRCAALVRCRAGGSRPGRRTAPTCRQVSHPRHTWRGGCRRRIWHRSCAFQRTPPRSR
jgi:hypothetical protein